MTARTPTVVRRMARTVTTEADRASAASLGPERASSRSAYSRLPLGTKILIPFFAMTLCTALVAGIFFTSIEVAKDRAVQADAGKATAVMVRGALVPMPDDPSSIRAFLRSVVGAYPKVAALCVLTADHGNPLGPLVVYASAGEATGCDASSPLVPVLGTPGVVSGPRQTTAGAVGESVAGASLSSFGETAVVVVQVRLTPTADLAVPLFRDSAAAGILLGVVQTLLVYSVLKTWALRPLRQLRLKASATARAARPIGIDRFTAAILAGGGVHHLL